MPRTASTRTIRDDENLVDGVPVWMKGSAIAWIRRFTTESRGRDLRTREIIHGPSEDRIHAIERYLQINLPDDDENEYELQNNLIDYCQDEVHCLDIIEAILATNNNVDQTVETMNAILIESGSKWKAIRQDGRAVLEERVDATTTEAFDSATGSGSDDSSQLLKKAWGFAFGRNPSPSEAYNYSIKAMEAATWPVITPNNHSATLGHILGEIRSNPNKWHSQITEKQSDLGSTMLVNAMQLLWEGHTDRHGTSTPIPVTQEAAEQAVFTAVMICAYFNRGYIVKT